MYSSGPDAVHYATHIQSGFDGDFINITNDGSSSALIPGGTGTATTSSATSASASIRSLGAAPCCRLRRPAGEWGQGVANRQRKVGPV